MATRSEHVFHCLRLAYAHQVALILETYEGPWEDKVEHLTFKALLSTQEEQVLHTWGQQLEQLEPPGHPAEYPALMSTQYRWLEVIDDSFVEHLKMLLFSSGT